MSAQKATAGDEAADGREQPFDLGSTPAGGDRAGLAGLRPRSGRGPGAGPAALSPNRKSWPSRGGSVLAELRWPPALRRGGPRNRDGLAHHSVRAHPAQDLRRQPDWEVGHARGIVAVVEHDQDVPAAEVPAAHLHQIDDHPAALGGGDLGDVNRGDGRRPAVGTRTSPIPDGCANCSPLPSDRKPLRTERHPQTEAHRG